MPLRAVCSALYTLAFLGANLAAAEPQASADALSAAREGDLRKLLVHDPRRPAPETEFFTASSEPVDLEYYAGKPVVLNFWATWCAPCRVEMPTLEALQREFGEDEVQVLAVATGRNSRLSVHEFFMEVGIEDITVAFDPGMALARSMGVFGLPTTAILDSDGMEVGRLVGEADWSSDSAVNIIGMLASE